MNNHQLYDWAKTDTSFMTLYKSEADAVYNTIDYHTGPENKRELPCDTCSMAAKCETGALECAAFRNWASNGDYKDSDVARLVRGAK